jgi:hypothetical protein
MAAGGVERPKYRKSVRDKKTYQPDLIEQVEILKVRKPPPS